MADNNNTTQAQKTLEKLRAVISRKGDFPSISGAVRQIVSAMREEGTSDIDLAQSVLSDFAMTQKVIRLANSAMYAGFGGEVTTVSRAIYVLGTETVGHVALGLKFIDQLDKAAGNVESARAEFAKVMVAGTVSRKVTETMSARETEASVVCTLLHNLGRLLVTFYLPDEWQKIVALMESSQRLDEQDAAEVVLGLTLHELGQELAGDWGLPADLTLAMRRPVLESDHPLSHADWLASLANFSTECSKVLATSTNPDADMKRLAETYSGSLGIESSSLAAAAASAADDEECQKLIASGRGQQAASECEKPLDAFNRLDSGLRDMEALAETADLGTLAGLMIESMQTSMGFRRVYVFLRNNATRKMAARMALGAGARELMPQLTFDEAFEPDIFHFSLAQNRAVFLDDVKQPSMQSRLPRWFKAALPKTNSFVCIPVVAGTLPVGLVYGDWETSEVQLKVEPHELAKLVKMRDVLLSVLMRQKK
jgi:HD-like signal output (HDOD) protein